jgi:pyruvate-formate lyase-activating enzyme
MEKKYFPIKTATACQLKWAWSTVYLNTGITRSCHRTGESELTADNFVNFHNTPLKLEERTDMLQGRWPTKSCSYCKDIEAAGGISDRIRFQAIPGLTPVELEEDPTAINVDPPLVEVYFSNACNLGCLYCADTLSSVIEAENRKFGLFENKGVRLELTPGHFKELVPHFWFWFETGFQKVRRLHVLGGEPFYQKEFDKLLDMIEQYPNPECELNVVTNLMVSNQRIREYVDRFEKLLVKRLIKRVDITCSIDCWGPEQEYVRWGIDLEHWDNNFQYLLSKKWLTININQTIMPLTIKTMPDLLTRLAEWRKQRPVGHFFSGIEPAPDYLRLDIFGSDLFKQDIQRIMQLMPQDNEQDCAARGYMEGILNIILKSKIKVDKVKDLIIYLDEKDRRRGTDWELVFPWLVEFKKHVV